MRYLQILVLALLLTFPDLESAAMAQATAEGAPRRGGERAIPKLPVSDADQLARLKRFVKPPIIKPMPDCDLCNDCCKTSSNIRGLSAASAMAERPRSLSIAKAPACQLWSEAEFVDDDYKRRLRELDLRPKFIACHTISERLLKSRSDGSVIPSAADEKLATEYAEACFDERLTLLGEVSTAADRMQVAEQLMFVSRRIDRTSMSCHGFRLGNLVITALHCARSRGLFLPVEMQVRTVDNGRLLEAEEIFPADEGGYDPQQRAGSDVAVLRIIDAGFSSETRPPFDWLAAPSRRGRLVTVQSNIYVRAAAKQDDSSDATHTLRFRDTPLCRLVDVSPDGDLLHSCATEHGTSGAPLFQRGADGKLRLVGVHAGSVEPWNGPPSWRGCEHFNYGARVPLTRIHALLAEHR